MRLNRSPAASTRVVASGLAVLLVLAGSVIAIRTGLGAPGADAGTRLRTFGDCDALAKRMRDLGAPEDAPTPPASTSTSSPDAMPDPTRGATDVTQSVQEPGPGDPDVAKSDGRILVTVAGGGLRVMDVSGKRPVARGTLDLPIGTGLYASQLLVAGTRALVISTRPPYGGRSDSGYDAGLSLVDLSDREHPRLLAAQEITGRFAAAHLTGGVARVVVSTGSATRPRPDARGAEADGWLPSRRTLSTGFSPAAAGVPLVACDGVRYPPTASGGGMLTVLTYDLRHDDAFETGSSTAVVGSGLAHFSDDRLYLVTTRGGGGPGPRGSSVHAFDITTPTRTTYAASGNIDGRLPGRWALSARDGDLRLVTTSRRPWLDRPHPADENRIVVLREFAGVLAEVGRVSGFGTGPVRAVHWLDDRAALVTVGRTGSLQLVDLGVPNRPALRGSLEIPTSTTYLIPAGEHALLGVGQDGGPEIESGDGLQISSFDIEDPARPRHAGTLSYGPGSGFPVFSNVSPLLHLPGDRAAVLQAQFPGTYCEPAAQCKPGTTSTECGFYRYACGRPASYNFGFGLLAIRLADDGRPITAAAWDAGDYTGTRGWYDAGPVAKILALKGGARLAAIDSSGVTILDGDTLAVRAVTRFPGWKRGSGHG